jgi:hypothetical protein
MSICGLQSLLMILGGKVAAEFRALAKRVFTRVMAGDQSLINVINANAVSDAPIHQIYRETLTQEPVVEDELSLTHKRKREELQIAMLEADLETKKLANVAMARANVAMARDSMFDHLDKITVKYQDLCQDIVMDERARLMLKDSFLNMAMATQQNGGLITNDPQQISPNKSLSSVAIELGLKIHDNEFLSLGRQVSKRYFQLHGKKPTKHDQLIKGKVTLVNSYMESDRPIVEEVLRKHMS